MTSDTPTVLRFVARLQRQGAVRCRYEAGPCGFELHRALPAKGIPCDIIAPALIPRRPGDRIKTDRRDAGQLAVLYRAEALTAVHIPTEQEEAAPRSPPVSGGHPRRSPPRPTPPLEVSPPPWPALHGHQEGLVETP